MCKILVCAPVSIKKNLVSLHHDYIIPCGIVGNVIPYCFVILLCAFDASRSENVFAISVCVLTKSIAFSNNRIASSLLPLKKR